MTFSFFPSHNSTVIDCGTLPDPTNGTVTLMGTRLGAEASYNCTEGFRINGTTNRTCQMDDEWSGSEPTCDRKGRTKTTS